ncbi:MAG: type II secretion system F family protein [Fimbriimonas sp.]|nr:type II secretion system F family protein [Fimbriimonas sp.]
MATYAFTVLEPSGQRKSGFVEANTREAAVIQLTQTGSFLLDLNEQAARSGFGGGEEKKTRGKPSRADMAMFSRRMADLADAGLPLDRVLQVVAEQSENQYLTEVAEAALEDVRGGASVSAALGKYPKVFPEVFTSTLQAGEASGQFAEVAARLSEFQEKEVARRSTIASAMVYPSILGGTAIMVVIFILTFVIPKLSDTFEAQGDKLPTPTKILMASGAFISTNWLIIIGGIIGAVVLYRLWTATEAGAEIRDRIMLKIPLIGKIIQKATVSRFARVLGTLVFGGVQILDALELAGIAAGNRVFRRSAIEVRDAVREGRPIAEAMRDTRAFPAVLTHMVAVGEETGDLPKMLTRVSDALDFEVDNGLRRATSLVEPMIVLFMGVFVGFVVLAILVPILNSATLVK